jgi:5-methylcytosine-specific restriction endonuclease McrA
MTSLQSEIKLLSKAEKNRARVKAWRKANPDKWHLQQKKYREKHPEANKIWVESNREKVRQYKKKWDQANPDSLTEKTNRRRARKLQVEVEKFTQNQVLETYGTACHICQGDIDLKAPRRTNIKGFEFGLHIDHVVPLAKGGSHTLANSRPAHAICNLKKGAKYGAAA